MNCHVILQKFDFSESVTTDIANVLLLVLGVVSLHMQSKVFLSIELFTTFITGVVEVCTMTHLFMFQQFSFPLITFLTFITTEGFVSAMYVLHVIVEPGIAGEVFGADVTHEARSGPVLLQVESVQRVLGKLYRTVTAALAHSVRPPGTFVEMIDEFNGAGVTLANVLLADRTVETRGLLVEIRTIGHNVQASLVVSPEVMFEKLSVMEDLV